MRDAKAFLAAGKKEFEKGRATADYLMVREGAEKVFHALNQASAARIQKYGLAAPTAHDEIRRGLQAAHDKKLLNVYEEAFSRLHVSTYYQGWMDFGRIEEQVASVEKAIQDVEKTVRR